MMSEARLLLLLRCALSLLEFVTTMLTATTASSGFDAPADGFG